MTKIRITTAQATDAPTLLQMVRGLAKHHGDAARVTEADLARDLSDGWLFGLIAHGPKGVIGYALLTPQAQAQHGLRGMDLHHLYVLQDARGKGVGTAIIAAAEDLAVEHGASYMVIGANSDNVKAQEFYASQGYEQRTSSSRRFRKTLP